MPIPEFSFSGDQVFSGTTASPTILAGSYPIADALYSDVLNFDDEGALGSATITGTQGVCPRTVNLLAARYGDGTNASDE